MLCCIFTIGLAQAQESIHIKGKDISGKEAQPDYWLFSDAQDTIVALHYSEYVQMVRKMEVMQLQVAAQDSILKAKNELLAVFDNYEQKAETHILTQDSLLNYADSLYRGYKDLYHDMKSLADINKFGLLLGTGVHKYDTYSLKYVFDLGVEYNKIQLSSQFGEKYKAFTVSYRIPLF
jgi:hypothetical protein